MAGQHVERRLAAILAGDVAGYSRLMGDDEEAHSPGSTLTGVNFLSQKSRNTAAVLSSALVMEF